MNTNTLQNINVGVDTGKAKIGRRAKTDKLDAQLIAHYSDAIQPQLTQLKPEIMQLMSDLVARRHQILTMQTYGKKTVYNNVLRHFTQPLIPL